MFFDLFSERTYRDVELKMFHRDSDIFFSLSVGNFNEEFQIAVGALVAKKKS